MPSCLLNISNSFSIVFVFFILLQTFYLSCAKEKKLGVVAKKDLKYIGCEVCERAISGFMHPFIMNLINLEINYLFRTYRTCGRRKKQQPKEEEQE